ncbi:TadE/TadG family type IV pilus assembly protein [Streptomyces sp. NPDC020719]|uniref:TadE/TadG family type IV pilus assembly protein n=1 Tax=Streptomyces sp. NPDC020719 TaxID=3154896 RepID=UPI00340B4720
MTVELVLLIPVLILMLWFLIFCGRMADSRLRIEDAAHQAARAASMQRTDAEAAAHARATAVEALNDAGITCRSLAVDTSGSVRPGGTVTATVACRVDLHDLGLLRMPGTAMLDARFTAPVDTHRGTAATAAREGDEP